MAFPKKGSCSYFLAGQLTNSLMTPLQHSRAASSLAGWFVGINEFSLAKVSADFFFKGRGGWSMWKSGGGEGMIMGCLGKTGSGGQPETVDKTPRPEF